MCVSCVSLHLGKAFCIVSCHNLFLCCCCSFLTCCNSLLFYFIRYIIGNFLVFVLSVYVCVFLDLSASGQGFLHHVTSRLVSLLLLLLLLLLCCCCCVVVVVVVVVVVCCCCCVVCCCDLFCCCCCSFLTCYNSLLFYFIRYIIGNYFVVVLSVYGCIYFSAIFDFCEAFCIMCHIATCFFVDVVDFSLVTTLFVLFH